MGKKRISQYKQFSKTHKVAGKRSLHKRNDIEMNDKLRLKKRLEIVQSGIFNEQNVWKKIQVLHIIDGKQLIKFVKNKNRENLENGWKKPKKQIVRRRGTKYRNCMLCVQFVSILTIYLKKMAL